MKVEMGNMDKLRVQMLALSRRRQSSSLMEDRVYMGQGIVRAGGLSTSIRRAAGLGVFQRVE